MIQSSVFLTLCVYTIFSNKIDSCVIIEQILHAPTPFFISHDMNGFLEQNVILKLREKCIGYDKEVHPVCKKKYLADELFCLGVGGVGVGGYLVLVESLSYLQDGGNFVFAYLNQSCKR